MEVLSFEGLSIRSWLSHGMIIAGGSDRSAEEVKARKPSKTEAASRTRTGALVALVAAATVGASFPNFLEWRGQTAVAYPATGRSLNLIQNALSGALKSITSLGDDWQGTNSVRPTHQSIKAAEYLIPTLPAISAKAGAGVDGDGNVYLKFEKGEKLAYLTVEPAILHLLVMRPQGNLYIDDVRFEPGKLPSKILKALEQEMVG